MDAHVERIVWRGHSHGEKDDDELGRDDPVVFARERLGFEPDAVQAELLRSRGRRVLLNCSRQWGKSTVAAVKAVHVAWFRPGSLVVVLGPSARQSGELLLKIREFLRVLGERLRGSSGLSLRLKNRSRIVGLPAKEGTVRGFSAVDLLLVDEASRVPDVLYRAVRPMLTRGRGGAGGDLWVMSTPCGKRGFFWTEWSNGGPYWTRVTARATECARFSAEILEEERRSGGERWFGQEYLCEFHDAEGALFREELVQAAFVDDVKALKL
jgi:hypothetical protein